MIIVFFVMVLLTMMILVVITFFMMIIVVVAHVRFVLFFSLVAQINVVIDAVVIDRSAAVPAVTLKAES